jgi:hypothetical protein
MVWECNAHIQPVFFSSAAYSICPIKTNLELDVIYFSTMNVNICMFRFVVLRCVTSGTGLVFYGRDEVQAMGGEDWSTVFQVGETARYM